MTDQHKAEIERQAREEVPSWFSDFYIRGADAYHKLIQPVLQTYEDRHEKSEKQIGFLNEKNIGLEKEKQSWITENFENVESASETIVELKEEIERLKVMINQLHHSLCMPDDDIENLRQQFAKENNL